jgi:cation transport regulator ChaB
MAATSRNGKGVELDRVTFEESRSKEYFDLKELQTMTGQPAIRFGASCIKEGMDNALDAAEMTGVEVPEVFLHVRASGKDLHISIRDNGIGMDEEKVKKTINFATRTSDKALYRAATRGMQGNALKTIYGIPYSLGCRKPIVIESKGKRHFLRPKIDLAGEASINMESMEVSERPGTRILLAIPRERCPYLDPHHWARAFSLFNAHAVVKIRIDVEESTHADSRHLRPCSFYYSPTVRLGDGWKKPVPADLTSPHSYDFNSLGKLIFGLVNLARRGDESKNYTLRQFVMQFAGLTGSEKAAQVCSALPEIKRLADFEGNERLIHKLLSVMQVEARVVKAASLGCIGEHHFRRRFDQWFGVVEGRFWYKPVFTEIDKIPYVFEVAVAETKRRGCCFHGINYSPTFQDPFSDTRLELEALTAYGAESFLQQTHAHPISERPTYTAVATHLITPNLVVLDKGKTRTKVPEELAELIAGAMMSAVKVIYKEEEKRRKDAAKQERADLLRWKASRRNDPLTWFVEAVVPEALEHATGWLYQVSAHKLFYAARKIFQKYTDRILESQYFEHTLLPAYLKDHPDYVKWIYREPRGVLYEPHTGIELPLGTREVEAYQFPRWRFSGILFFEKAGLWPAFKTSRIAERYDRAVTAGEGVACEACRVLFQKAEEGDPQLFVLHDADPYGYNIYRTLREETPRMPGYKVDVIDLGLKLEEALELGYEPEKADRDKAYPQEIIPSLTPLEREYFDGQKLGKKYIYKRVELDAFTAPDPIKHTERKLKAKKARGKVIPPADRLSDLVKPIVSEVIGGQIQAEIRSLLSTDAIVRQITDTFIKTLPLDQSHALITQGFAADPHQPWGGVLHDRFSETVQQRRGELREAVRLRLQEGISLDL